MEVRQTLFSSQSAVSLNQALIDEKQPFSHAASSSIRMNQNGKAELSCFDIWAERIFSLFYWMRDLLCGCFQTKPKTFEEVQKAFKENCINLILAKSQAFSNGLILHLSEMSETPIFLALFLLNDLPKKKAELEGKLLEFLTKEKKKDSLIIKCIFLSKAQLENNQEFILQLTYLIEFNLVTLETKVKEFADKLLCSNSQIDSLKLKENK